MINPINFNFSFNTNPITQAQRVAPQSKMLLNKVNEPAVSFTGRNEDLVRSIGNVSCPCCGVKMMTKQDLEKYTKELSKNPTAKHYSDTLEKYQDFMHKAEKDVFKRFKPWAEEHPKSSLSNFLNESRVDSIQACKQMRTEKLATITKMVAEVDMEKGKEFAKAAVSYNKIPYESEESMKDVRKYVLSDVENLKNKIEDKEKYIAIRRMAESLPTAKNSSDAFIVKYAGDDSGKIGKRLLKLSVGTIEHIKPQAKGGKDRVENYLLECGECNHTRGEIPLDDWIEVHPEMVENTQKYFDEIIEKINNGDLKGLENYPNMVRGALQAQSKGTLDYDTSALKPQKGKHLNVAA